MEISNSFTLVKLGDTDLRLAEAGEDVRGKNVVDADGEDIGQVDDLMIDDSEKKVRFLEVASGGFLGVGQTKFLIPVDAITKIDANTVHVDRSRQHVAGAPQYDPEVTDQRYVDSVYNYYGFPPFWGAGYVYPRYPYYV